MADFEKNFDYYGFWKSGGVYGNDSNEAALGVQYYIEPLALNPVTPEFFKQHARIDFDTDNDLVEIYVSAATKFLEEYTQKSFGSRTITLNAEYLPRKYRLMYGPVDTVTSGEEVVGDVLVDEHRDVEITYTSKDILRFDPVVQIAICRYAAGLYIEREDIIETKWGNTNLKSQAEQMLSAYRNIIFP